MNCFFKKSVVLNFTLSESVCDKLGLVDNLVSLLGTNLFSDHGDLRVLNWVGSKF